MNSAETHPVASANVDLPFGFDPLSRVFRSDPWRTYERMRREKPVHRSPLGHVDADPETGGAARAGSDESHGANFAVLQGPARPRPPRRPGEPCLHASRDRAHAAASRGDRRRASRPARDHGAIDVIRDLAFPLPVRVIAEMLGVPQSDRDRFHYWTQSMNLSFEPAITPEQARRCHEAVGELDAYLRALIRERRSQPREDILSVLIAAEVDEAGGFVSVSTGSAPEANSLPVSKAASESALDAAACIGCGACVAACPNASAMLFTAAKVSHLALAAPRAARAPAAGPGHGVPDGSGGIRGAARITAPARLPARRKSVSTSSRG